MKEIIIRHIAADGCPIGRFMKVIGISKTYLTCYYLQEGVIVDKTSNYIVSKRKAHIYKTIVIPTTLELIELIKKSGFNGYVKYKLTKRWEQLCSENAQEVVIKYTCSQVKGKYVYVKFEKAIKTTNKRNKKLSVTLFGVHVI